MKTIVHNVILTNPRDAEEAAPFHLCENCAHGDSEVAIIGDSEDADAVCLDCGLRNGCECCGDTDSELFDGVCGECHRASADWEATKASLNAWIVRGR
jgi:hypothetical protein